MTEIVPPPSAADIERMARHVISTQAAFNRACEAEEAARKAKAHAQMELEKARETLYVWMDDLPMIVDGLVFYGNTKSLRMTAPHTPQTLSAKIASNWFPEDKA